MHQSDSLENGPATSPGKSGSFPLQRRPLGKTNEKLSILGFGGIVVSNATSHQAARRVGEAIDAGINYFDVAPADGNAQQRLGPALKSYRKGVFLACKTGERERVAAEKQLEDSLKKLKTDYFDLYQLHAVTSRQDVETIFSADGAIHALLAAQRSGKVRLVGFSAHSVEAALELMERFAFDTILFPVNYATWHVGNFGPQVLATALEKEMGILALKAMAKGERPKGDPRNEHPKCWYQPFSEPADLAMGLRFTLSHPVTAAIAPGDETLFRLALRVAVEIEPLTAKEATRIQQKAKGSNPIFRYPSDYEKKT